MLYSFDINNSCKYGYLTYTLDYYDIKDTKCETCGRTKQNIYLKYWPPKMTLEGGKKYYLHLGYYKNASSNYPVSYRVRYYAYGVNIIRGSRAVLVI